MNTTAAGPGNQLISPYLDAPSPTAILLPIFAFIAIIIDTPCLIWHISSHNMVASILVGWVMVQNLIVFLGAVIWPTDDLASFWHGKGYCDVVVKLDWMGGAAITAATMCITRALAAALDTNGNHTPGESYGGKLRNKLLNYVLCILFPIYMAIAAFLVQSHRYYIYAISGCVMVEWHSLATIFLCYIPPIALMVGTCYYAILTIVRLRRYKRDIASVLASTDSGLSRSRFMRLLGLSLVLLIIYTPLLIAIVISEEATELYPFDWAQIHDPKSFNVIILVQTFGQARIDRWVRVSIGYVVFACFGFGKDVRVTYRKCLRSLGLSILIPILRLDGEGQRAGGQSSPTTPSYPRSVDRSSHSSQTTFKGRARYFIEKLSLSSRSSASSTTTSHVASKGSPTQLRFDAQKSKSPLSLKSDLATPIRDFLYPQNPVSKRPNGIMEQALYDCDASENEKVTSNAAVIPDMPADNIKYSSGAEVSGTNAQASAQHEPLHHHTPRHGPTGLDSLPPRREFLQRLSAYVQSMGPRPANNLGVARGHSPEKYSTTHYEEYQISHCARAGVSRDISGAKRHHIAKSAADTEVDDLSNIRDREYEMYVVSQLA